MAEAATAVAVPAATPLAPRRQEVRVVADPIAVLDTARFEHMQRIATVMAHSNLIPDTLCFEKQGDQKVALPMEVVTANCFLVVNQAVRWNMDPFAVAQCVSVVHGKLCYEGKLIAAVLEGKLGVELEYEISGQGEAMKVVVTGTVNSKPVLDSKGRPKIVEGTVADWKTDGRGSPWAARGGYPRMLRYRGAREWGRVHAPGLMLGVYGDDEMEDLNTRFSSRPAAITGEVVDDGPPSPANDEASPPNPSEETTATGPMEDEPPVPDAPDSEVTGQRPDSVTIKSERHWLLDLEANFSKAEDIAELADMQDKLMTPHQEGVSEQAWSAASEILDHHVERLQVE